MENLNISQETIDKALEIIKKVAHVGVDFGFGVYELDSETISEARKILEGLGE